MTLQATGCPNREPYIEWWKTQTDEIVFSDMLNICILVRDGHATDSQKRECCGENIRCGPIFCNRQSTWVTGILLVTYISFLWLPTNP